MARSEPQIPARRVRTRAQPSPFGRGSVRFTKRRGARGPASKPGTREPTARAATYRGTERNSSSASVTSHHPAPSYRRSGNEHLGRPCRVVPFLHGPAVLPGHAVKGDV